jgi:hypothetical protein
MAKTPEARMRGYQPGRFSFNVKGGRCEACSGDGQIKIEMHFLPDIYVTCEVCGGKRYDRETLSVRYKGLNIAEILDLSVEQAREVFQNIPPVERILSTLDEVGLGYIRLGQPATTLSGGEAQRVKLARELCKRNTGRTLYLLDEPTTGLHFRLPSENSRWNSRGRCRLSWWRTRLRSTATRMRIHSMSWPRCCRMARARASIGRWSTKNNWRLPRLAMRSSSNIRICFMRWRLCRRDGPRRPRSRN